MKKGIVPDLPPDFAALPQAEQRRVLEAGNELVHLGFRHAAAVCIAPPPSQPAKINNGTACVFVLDSKHYLLTADHVVRAWRDRRNAGEPVLFQVGDAALDPDNVLAWRDEKRDIAVLRVTDTEVKQIGVSVCEPLFGWPPPHPKTGDYVLISGYPEFIREQQGDKRIMFNALSTLLQVTSHGEDYAVCQFDRENWVSFDMSTIPAPGTWLGGMSGGPVLRVGTLAYPLIGLSWEYNESLELLYFRTLSRLPTTFE